MKLILDDLPDIYGAILPEALARPVPDESLATCASCAMCPESPRKNTIVFREDVKCCSWHPTLANYLVGGLLSDPRAGLEEGRRRIRAKIERREGVLPRWVHAPIKSRLLHAAGRAAAFGRSEVLRCPYFNRDSGGCTIWAWRESVCSTFFCKYDHGAHGQTFWRRVKRYLDGAEAALAAYAVREVAGADLGGLPPGRRWLTHEELEDQPPAETDYVTWWGEWAGREVDFYKRCYVAVMGLDRAAAGELLAHLQPRLDDVLSAHAELEHPTVPTRLTVNPKLRVLDHDAETVLVQTYNDYDATELPISVFNLLTAGQLDAFDDELMVGLYERRLVVEGEPQAE